MHAPRPTARALTARCANWKAGYKKVFRETASGAKIDRGQLREALDQFCHSQIARYRCVSGTCCRKHHAAHKMDYIGKRSLDA
jgi:hypothetical protein